MGDSWKVKSYCEINHGMFGCTTLWELYIDFFDRTILVGYLQFTLAIFYNSGFFPIGVIISMRCVFLKFRKENMPYKRKSRDIFKSRNKISLSLSLSLSRNFDWNQMASVSFEDTSPKLWSVVTIITWTVSFCHVILFSKTEHPKILERFFFLSSGNRWMK
jgi:hypothetical protein